MPGERDLDALCRFASRRWFAPGCSARARPAPRARARSLYRSSRPQRLRPASSEGSTWRRRRRATRAPRTRPRCSRPGTRLVPRSVAALTVRSIIVVCALARCRKSARNAVMTTPRPRRDPCRVREGRARSDRPRVSRVRRGETLGRVHDRRQRTPQCRFADVVCAHRAERGRVARRSRRGARARRGTLEVELDGDAYAIR